jgi:hypothetical protein
MNDLQAVMRQLSRYRRALTRQQLRTLRGLALAGDTAGAIAGLRTILRKWPVSKLDTNRLEGGRHEAKEIYQANDGAGLWAE